MRAESRASPRRSAAASASLNRKARERSSQPPSAEHTTGTKTPPAAATSAWCLPTFLSKHVRAAWPASPPAVWGMWAVPHELGTERSAKVEAPSNVSSRVTTSPARFCDFREARPSRAVLRLPPSRASTASTPAVTSAATWRPAVEHKHVLKDRVAHPVVALDPRPGVLTAAQRVEPKGVSLGPA